MSREARNHALYDAMVACLEYVRANRTPGRFRLYWAALDMWRALAKGNQI